LARQRLTLAWSTDVAEAFVFYALAQGIVDTRDIQFDCRHDDIETLNVWLQNGELDVSMSSLHAYASASEEYVVLPHGFAVGEGCGPRLVGREKLDPGDLKRRVVAVPGRLTSLHLILRLFEPDVEVRLVRRDEVPDYVRAGFADAGVVMYDEQAGPAGTALHTLLDLGDWWLGETGLPLPLRCAVVRRDLGDETILRVCRYLRESIEHGLDNRSAALQYASDAAGVPDGEVVDGLVGRYVNRRTLDVGADGREAVRELLMRGHRAGLIGERPQIDFFDY
jgi:1,4-dihydroxy-6-naphthoate synthase